MPGFPETGLMRVPSADAAHENGRFCMSRAWTARLLLCAGLLGLATGPARAEEIFVSNERDNTVSVIDGTSLEVVRTFPVGRRPRGLTFSRDGRTLYVCASDSDAVQVIDPETGRYATTCPPARIRAVRAGARRPHPVHRQRGERHHHGR